MFHRWEYWVFTIILFHFFNHLKQRIVILKSFLLLNFTQIFEITLCKIMNFWFRRLEFQWSSNDRWIIDWFRKNREWGIIFFIFEWKSRRLLSHLRFFSIQISIFLHSYWSCLPQIFIFRITWINLLSLLPHCSKEFLLVFL